MASHRDITQRALRLLARNREQIKQVYIDTYLQETGYSIEQCELVETIQQVGSAVQTSWFMRLREVNTTDGTPQTSITTDISYKQRL